MTTTKKTLTVIWTATYDWLKIAERQGFGVNWDADPITGDDEWIEACEVAWLNADDYEVGFAAVASPRDCDTLLRAGDIIATSGTGGDVTFLRRV